MSTRAIEKADTPTPIEIWQLTTDGNTLFNANHVIDAYLTGKEMGKSELKNELILKLVSQLDELGTMTKELVSFLKKNSIGFDNAYLKIEGYNSFTILVVVSEAGYLSDSFKRVYEYVGDVENKLSAKYEIYYSFTGKSESFNPHIVSAEGYKLKLQYKD
jgi:hypothetical protein